MIAPASPSRILRVGLACGGTGGHIFPGLATASVLRERGHEVTLWLAGKDIEASAVRDWVGPRHTVKAEGFQYGLSWKSVRTAWRLAGAIREARNLMKGDKPDVVLAMGSYASVGPVAAALTLRVPVVLHEANVTPGRVVELFARRARLVAGCFEESRHYLRKVDLVLTGMPLRKDLEAAGEGFQYRPMRNGALNVLVMGGSRGAKAVNVVASNALDTLYRSYRNLRVVHLTGRDQEAEMRAFYPARGIPAEVHPFVHDMSELYKKTDLAICRAGAATCAELCLFGIPSLLVPYPFAAKDHQTLNAEAMHRAGAADVVAEKDLEAEWLAEYLEGCLHTPSRLERISRAAKALGHASSARELAECVEKAAEKKKGRVEGEWSMVNG
jgi:UDP-N-acetylglucosamine--N-acetylmuramyl-(pentapeptide) pyrophosphoryl-undecaprenol N-acetylglucosamine transferase